MPRTQPLQSYRYERPFHDTHFDIKVINTQADTHKQVISGEAMRKTEDAKDRLYKERLQKVENLSFNPLIFTTKGAKSRKTSRAIAKIATQIAIKRKEEKHEVSSRIATELSFLFLRMELACIRGRRKPRIQQP